MDLPLKYQHLIMNLTLKCPGFLVIDFRLKYPGFLVIDFRLKYQ